MKKKTGIVEFQTYKRFQIKKVSLLPHSRLYSLEPVGIGTPYVESLISYLFRLSQEHCLSIFTLFHEEVAPVIRSFQNNDYKPKRPRNISNLALYTSAWVVNGGGTSASLWVQALEALTLRQDLRLLTTLPWGSAVSNFSLLRESVAWCSICYEEWKQDGIVIHQPLVWMIKPVTICPRHRKPLEQVCRYCKHTIRFANVGVPNGYCSQCRKWLGHYGSNVTSDSIDVQREEMEQQVWRANTIAEWIGMAQQLTTPPTLKEITKTFSKCITKIAKGKNSALGRFIDLEQPLVHNLKVGFTLPKLEYVLKTCLGIGVSLSEFLTGNIFCEKGLSGNRLRELSQKVLAADSKFSAHVEQTLEAALTEEPPPLVAELAVRLNYTSTTPLIRNYTDMCRRINKRYEEFLHAQGKTKNKNARIAENDEIKQRLELALAQDFPPSHLEIAIELGYANVRPLYEKFQELCYRIREKRAQPRRELLLSIKSDLEAALKEKPSPSFHRVLSRRGIKNRNGISKVFPELHSAITARYLAWKSKAHLKERRSNLRAALKEKPPPPLSQVVRRYGYDKTGIRRHLPDLCSEISDRYLKHRKKCLTEGRRLLKVKVREIVADFRKRGEYPSRRKILKHFVNPPQRGHNILVEVLREVKLEI